MFLLLVLVEFAAAGTSAASPALGGIEQIPAIFQFGDSLSDTGNALIAFPQTYKCLNTSPYGETFFHRPSGRQCDGRILIDFLAFGHGLPLLDPYLQLPSRANWRHGVNFAVCSACALGFSFFDEHNISILGGNRDTFMIDVQLQWFHNFRKTSMLPSNQGRTHPSPDDFSRALYVIGEIGGNDYTNMRINGMDYSQVFQFVPFVVQSIRNLIQDLHSTGARKFFVINIPRQGCTPAFLQSRDPSDQVDELGCIADVNAINSHHNSLLRIAVDDLRSSLDGVSIAYADYYALIGDVLRNPEEHGFAEPRAVCCGSPWQNTIVDCVDGLMINGAMFRGQICGNPSTHIFWNGLHFTEHFYNVASDAFLKGQYIDLGTVDHKF